MTELCVSVATHHFVVTRVNPRAMGAVAEFARSLVLVDDFKNKRNNDPWRNSEEKNKDKVFAAATLDKSERRYHINCLPDFKEVLRKHFIHDGMVEWKTVPLPPAPFVKFKLAANAFEPHDYQVPIIDYIVNEEGPRSRAVDLQTGRGKTFIGLRAAYLLGKRIVMILKPKYVQQWIKEFKAAYDISDKEICEIGGSKDLISLLNMADGQDLPYKVIIISNATYRNWLSLYRVEGKNTLDMGYACLPQDLFQHIKAGFRMIDEVHEDFHLNFKCDLYTNVERSLSLSATWLFDQPFLARMMNVAYPPRERCVGGEYVKYVNSFYLTYRFRDPEKIKFSLPGNTSYSHHAFEQSIINQPRVLENYFLMIETAMRQTYVKNYLPGQKCLVYCISIDMCTRLTAWLKLRFHDKDVRRFVENDSEDDLYAAEICVSSIQNAGTGKDIPRLATVVLTIAINSSQSNIQGFGRLREPKDGSTPEFVYLVNEDIIKHWDYHEKKAELLASRALSNTKRVYTDLI